MLTVVCFSKITPKNEQSICLKDRQPEILESRENGNFTWFFVKCPQKLSWCIFQKLEMQKKAYPVSYHRHCHYHCQLLLHQAHRLLKIMSQYDTINSYNSCTFTALGMLGINS